jgi:hypothetical protein
MKNAPFWTMGAKKTKEFDITVMTIRNSRLVPGSPTLFGKCPQKGFLEHSKNL